MPRIDLERVWSKPSWRPGAVDAKDSCRARGAGVEGSTTRVKRAGQAAARKASRLSSLAVIVPLLIAGAFVLAPQPQSSDSHTAISSVMTSQPWIAESDQVGANLGYSVSSAGDVNNDGFEDIVVGAQNYDNGETDEGRAFLYLGSSSGLSSSYAWTAESNQAYARFGYSVSSAGDVDNDGYDDVLVGAYVYDNGQTDEGRAYLYLGSASGLSASPSWTAESDQASAYFGSSVSSAGDVNSDGYDDILVAALFYSNGESLEGRVYLYLGSPSGPSVSPSWISEGNQTYAYFGRSVASAGDVNNDGYADVVVGAYYYDNGESNEGRAFLYLGSSIGLSGSPSWTGESNQAGAWFGYSVSSAGDVNNDGYDDVVIGAVGYDNVETYEGSAYLYLGSASGLSASSSWTDESNQDSAYYGVVACAGDVNKDGYGDVIVGAYFYDNDTADEGRVFLYLGSFSGLSASPSWTAESDQSSAMFGSSLSSAGDVNNDGYDEIVIGAYSYDNDQTEEGRAYLYYDLAIPSPQVEFELNLVAGWNMVSLPLVGYGYKASTLPGLLLDDVVSGWNGTAYDQNYIIGRSPIRNDFAISESTGYWIYAGGARVLSILGSVPTGTQTKTVTVPDVGGWMMIGFSGLNMTRHASDINGMYTGGAVTTVAWYNPTTGLYQVYIGTPRTDFLLSPGQGLWIYCSASGVLTYDP